jgi:hypothetical protein
MTTWHVDPELLERYVGGDTGDVQAFSVEAHLPTCGPCRAALARLTDRGRHERVWVEVVDALDATQATWVERLLARLGVAGHTARLLAATPSLRGSWLAAVTVALGFAVIAGRGSHDGLLVFLLLAPVLPVAGVAAAYGPGIDPTYEVGVAAPMTGWRLLLLRAVAVLAATTVLAAGAAALLPGVGWAAIAWLLPSLGLAAATIALSTVTTPLRAGVLVMGTWVGAAWAVWRLTQDRFALFGQAGQVTFALLAMLAAAVVVARRDRFDQGASR